MNDREIIYNVDSGIATVTLNRPERMNALTPSLQAEMHRMFDQADADRAVRVIILTGSGNAFCAGYDQGQTSSSGTRHSDPKGKSLAEFIEFWQRNDGNRLAQWTHMWRLGKPVIAAVNGWAMGGGFWYQMAADITIASDRAVLRNPRCGISRTRPFFSPRCAVGRPRTGGASRAITSTRTRRCVSAWSTRSCRTTS